MDTKFILSEGECVPCNNLLDNCKNKFYNLWYINKKKNK
jgi:hypothetical protein